MIICYLSEIADAGIQMALWTSVLLLFLVGLLGTFVPILPGLPLIWLGILLDKVVSGADSVSWAIVAITAAITIVAQALDYLLSYWGVKRFGGTWRGGVGALIGLVAGFFLPPPLLWIIIAPIVGAIAGELVGGSTFKTAGKAGVGTLIGGIFSFVLKIGLGMTMIGLFFMFR